VCGSIIPSCGSAHGPRKLWLRAASDGHLMCAQVRHSRVTAVWDDEPVPAVPAPRDQTAARSGQNGQHTTQAHVRASSLASMHAKQSAPDVQSTQGSKVHVP